MGLVDPLLGVIQQALNEGKVSPTLETKHSASAKIFKSSSPKRDVLQVECSQPTCLQKQAQLGRAIGLRGIKKK